MALAVTSIRTVSAAAAMVGWVAGFAATSAAAEPAQAATAKTWPAAVAARYKLTFNGFDVGKYNFSSTFNGKAYQAASSADISALFGAFKWKGDIASTGSIDKAAAPQPADYKLNYKSKSKVVQVSLGFDLSGVKSISLFPKKPPHPEAVPLKPEHLKHVYDPMSAILAISHPSAGNPCNRTIPVFDGKVRFDLQMSAKGEQRIAEKKPTGQPTALVVCRVKYVPHAGHKPKEFAAGWVDYNGIEIALRPIPSAGLYVPYQISIPTSIGAAKMAAEAVTITGSDQTQIALTH